MQRPPCTPGYLGLCAAAAAGQAPPPYREQQEQDGQEHEQEQEQQKEVEVCALEMFISVFDSWSASFLASCGWCQTCCLITAIDVTGTLHITRCETTVLSRRRRDPLSLDGEVFGEGHHRGEQLVPWVDFRDEPVLFRLL